MSFLCFAPAFSVCLNAQVATNTHWHSLLDNHPFKQAKHVGCFSFPDRMFSFWYPLAKEFRRGELDDRQPSTLPLSSSLFSGSCFIPHLSSRTLTFCCPLYATSTVSFPLPSDLPLAAAAPEVGLPSYLSREEKCSSRTIRSKYRTTTFLVWCSLSIHLSNSMLSVQWTATASAVRTFEADGKK